MKVLYITENSPWPPRFGAALRNNGVVRCINERHDLHIALASTSQGDIEIFTGESPLECGLHVLSREGGGSGESDGFEMYGPGRLFASFLGRPVFSKSLHKLARTIRPDVVWYMGKESVRRAGLLKDIPCVVDFYDVPWRFNLRKAERKTGLSRIAAICKAHIIRMEDHSITRKTDAVVLSSHEETGLLPGGNKIHVVPNGFDFPDSLHTACREGKDILFIGSLFYGPNSDAVEWFCDEIWQKIRGLVPEARAHIIGKHDGSFDRYRNLEGVSFHGFVEDLEESISSGAMLVVPLRIAGGTRLKILEAWSHGLPVVSTTIGAEGLYAEHEKNLLIGDRPDEFAKECARLIDDPSLGERLARAGYEHGKAHFDWRNIGPAVSQVIDFAAGGSEQ